LIQGRLESKEELVPISELREGEVGEVQIMLFIPPLLETIASSGMDVGTRISRGDDGYSIEGNHFKIAAELSSSIIVRRC
jgi:hypothetical protein